MIWNRRTAMITRNLALAFLLGWTCAGSAAAKPRAKAAQTKETYQARLEAELRALDLKIAALKAEASKAGADTRAKVAAETATLESRRAAAHSKLDAVKASASEAWKDVKVGADKAMRDLRQTVLKVEADLKKK
jgi:hypothetical protein